MTDIHTYILQIYEYRTNKGMNTFLYSYKNTRRGQKKNNKISQQTVSETETGLKRNEMFVKVLL